MALIRPIPSASAEMKEMLNIYMHVGTGSGYYFTNGSTPTTTSDPSVITTASEYLTVSSTSIVAKVACKARVLLTNVSGSSSTYTEADYAAGATIATIPSTSGSFTIGTVEVI